MEYLIIQVEERQVTAARFGVSRRSATLAGSAVFALNDEQDLAAVAARMAEGISGSPRVVLCLAPVMFVQRAVELPLTDIRKVREVLAAHLQGETAVPVDEAVFDALPSGDGKFLALWALRAEIAAAIAIFKKAGLEPAVITSAPYAWNVLPGISGECAVYDGTALAIVTNGRLSFVRAINGEGSGREPLATLAALRLSGAEIPPRLFIPGAAPIDPALAATLGLEVARPVLPEQLAPMFKNEETFQRLAGLYAVALACHSGQLPDFRRGDLAWTSGDAKQRRRLMVTGVLAFVALALLFGSKGLQYRAVRADLNSLNGSISVIYREIFPTRGKAVDELAEVRGEIRKLAGAEGGGGILDLFKKIAEAKGTGINGLYEAELDGGALRIKGDARSMQAVNEFKAALAPQVASIELGEVKSRPDGMVTFNLTGTLREVKR